MKIREITFDDYEGISELVYKNNLYIYSFKYWKDLWLLNPYYKNINNKWVKGWVLEHDKKIVGFLGNFPMVYNFLRKDYIVAVATCWITAEKYRNYSLLLMKAYFNQKNIDTIGAGDTFFALCSLLIGSKIDNRISMLMGSIAASFSIDQLSKKLTFNNKILKRYLTHMFK